VSEGNHVVILLGRFSDRDIPVAQALAQEFGRDDAWGLAVVNAAPITLVSGLSADQAQAVREALAGVEIAGSKLEIRPDLDPDMSQLEWPAPPRIRGKLVSEMGAGGQKFTANLILPCPYTGQKMRLTLTVGLSRVASGETQLNIGASTAPSHPPQAQAYHPPAPAQIPTPPVMIPVPQLQRSPSRGTALPPIQPLPPAQPFPASRPVSAPIPVPAPQYAPRSAAPAAQAPLIIGLESLDELSAQDTQVDAPRVAPRPPSQPVSRPQRSPAGGVPLPDIPVLHNQPDPRSSGLLEMAQAMPAPIPIGAPMDMAAFEQRVGSGGFQQPAAKQQEQYEQIGQADQDQPRHDDSAVCSIFMGKSNNARAHQLMSELHGIPLQDAAKLCQKVIVPVAKDIGEADALEIKQRFAAINVPVRVTRKR
jgi:hypothetical protein